MMDTCECDHIGHGHGGQGCELLGERCVEHRTCSSCCPNPRGCYGIVAAVPGRQHGGWPKPIPAVRVSAAQARGAAKKYYYWGAARYELRACRDDALWHAVPTRRATSDRRSISLATQDAMAIAAAEGRTYIGSDIGAIPPDRAAALGLPALPATAAIHARAIREYQAVLAARVTRRLEAR